MDTGATRDAGSRLDDGFNGTYYLRGSFALSTTNGSSRLSVDTAAGSRCGAFATFGTWSMTLP